MPSPARRASGRAHCFVLVAFAGLAAAGCDEPPPRPAAILGGAWEPPLLLAHRGVKGDVPESTAAALDGVLALGAHGTEVDVQPCATGEVVVFHDHTMERLGGPKRAVAEMTVDEIRAVRLTGGHRVLTLDDLLDGYGGKLLLLLEMKRLTPRPSSDDDFELRVGRAIARRGLQDWVMVSSIDPAAVARLEAAFPGVNTITEFFRHRPAREPWIRRGPATDMIGPEHDYLDLDTVRHYRWLGYGAISTFTVNDTDELDRLLDLGVDLFQTDTPAVVLPRMKARGEWGRHRPVTAGAAPRLLDAASPVLSGLPYGGREAVDKALSLGFDGLSTRVLVMRDGVVIAHPTGFDGDTDLSRTRYDALPAARPKPVVVAQVLRALPAGAWAEVVAFQPRQDGVPGFQLDPVGDALAALLAPHAAGGRVALASAAPALLRSLGVRVPGVPTVLRLGELDPGREAVLMGLARPTTIAVRGPVDGPGWSSARALAYARPVLMGAGGTTDAARVRYTVGP